MFDDMSRNISSKLSRVVTATLDPTGPVRDLDLDQDLQELGLTSLNMVNLMLGIEGEMGFMIPKHELLPDNFRSLRAIEAMVMRITKA